MPWKSEKQRRWAHATDQPWAKEWDRKYNQGGSMRGLLDSADMDTTMTVKDKGGRTVTIKSPQGTTTDYQGILGGMLTNPSPTPVADDQLIAVTGGEYVVNQPATQKYKGLLDVINQEGREMLKQGGWVKKAKPMGYATGGDTADRIYFDHGVGSWVYKGQAYPSQAAALQAKQGFLEMQTGTVVREAPTGVGEFDTGNFDVAGVSATPNTNPQGDVGEAQPMPSEPTEPTNPMGGVSGGRGTIVEAPGERMAALTDQDVADADPAQIENVAKEAGADDNVAKEAGKMASANSIQEALRILDEGIEKQENKRDAMKTMVFGLSMLSGNGMAGSIQNANAVGRFNEKRIEELYAQRKTIQDKVTRDALGSTGEADGDYEVFSDTYVDAEGNIFHKLKGRAGYIGPDGEIHNASDITGLVKQGSQGADLPSSVLKANEKDYTSADDNETIAQEFDFVLEDMEEYGGAEGTLLGGLGESVKAIFGWQGGTSEWKTRYRKLKNEAGIKNLPPGVASDKDIELAMSGFPDENWDKEQLASWIKGYQKLLRYKASRDRFRADWRSDNRGQMKGYADAWKETDAYKDFVAEADRTKAAAGETTTGGGGESRRITL